MSDLNVQATNNSSIQSKWSMINAGYCQYSCTNDPFVRHFIAAATGSNKFKDAARRRAPLINRGYFVRYRAVDFIIDQFLQALDCSRDSSMKHAQILSLGSGFDPLYFRLRQKLKDYNNIPFVVEVDFKPLLERKLQVMMNTPELRCMLADEVKLSNDPDDSLLLQSADNYCLVACDLRSTDQMLRALSSIPQFKFDRPTLILSECVLTYLPVEDADRVIKWCAETFANDSLIVLYEQIRPYDTFGATMLGHFNKMMAPIHAIHRYPTLRSQAERLRMLGYGCRFPGDPSTKNRNETERTDHSISDIVDMNQFYSAILSAEERAAIDALEPFDEFEEWHIKCRHYFIATGFCGKRWVSNIENGNRAGMPFLCHRRPLSDISCGNLESFSLYDYYRFWNIDFTTAENDVNIVVKNPAVKRWGHTFTKVGDSALIFGGYGTATATAEGPVNSCRRLSATILVKNLSSGNPGSSLAYLDRTSNFICPEARIYHAAVPLPRLNSVLLFGGRGSPWQCFGDLWMFEISEMKWDCIHATLDDRATRPSSRYRHKACAAGDQYIYVYGGLTIDSSHRKRKVLGDLWRFDLSEKQWECIENIKPPLPKLHSFAMIAINSDALFIFGGLNEREQAQNYGYIVDLKNQKSQRFQFSSFTGFPILPCYSATACINPNDENLVLICGGVSLLPDGSSVDGDDNCSSIIWIDLSTRIWWPASIKSGNESPQGINAKSLYFSRKLWWPVGHNAVIIPRCNGDLELLINGGGGVCFSMGAYFNPTFQRIYICTKTIEEKLTHWKHRASTDWIRSSRLVPRVSYSIAQKSAELLESLVNRKIPFIVEKVPLGNCLYHWTNMKYLQEAFSGKVSVHVCGKKRLSFVAGSKKNYVFQIEQWNQFLQNCTQTSFGGEYRYLRAIGENPRKEPADFFKSFPQLAKDFALPDELTRIPNRTMGDIFSSVLRISSPGLHVWTHYDIMDNYLAQITGSKFITLFSPDQCENLHVPMGMNQSSSPATDIFSPYDGPFSTEAVQGSDINSNEFPLLKNALENAWTEVLRPGDVLFIPALWFHNTYAAGVAAENCSNLSPVISVNTFWKSLADSDLYDRKDLYGNKDLLPAIEAATHIMKAADALSRIPGSADIPNSFRGFYLKKIEQEWRLKTSALSYQ